MVLDFTCWPRGQGEGRSVFAFLCHAPVSSTRGVLLSSADEHTQLLLTPISFRQARCRYTSYRMATLFETPPQQGWPRNPFDMEPETPRCVRETSNMTRRVLGNLDKLYAPLFTGPMPSNSSLSLPRHSTHFNDALERMRDGSALQRLKQQRDIDSVRQEEAMRHLQELSTNIEPEKHVASSNVILGRQSPEQRRSGPARSA